MAESVDGPGPRRKPRRPEAPPEFLIERESTNPALRFQNPDSLGDAEKVREPFGSQQSAQSDLQYPASITRKYLIVPGPHASHDIARRAYADERGEYLVFKDSGEHLTTGREEAVVVRDLVAIAEHRAWTALKTSGSRPFRREVWLEASARGMIVRGYDPTDVDREALAKRQSARGRSDDRTKDSDVTRGSARASNDTARASASSAAARTVHERNSQERRPIAGLDTEQIPSRSAVRSGSERDPNRAAAYSHLAVLDRVLRRAFPRDEAAREAVLETARERLRVHLQDGRIFRHAEYAVPVRDRVETSERSAQRVAQNDRQRRPVRERDR